MSLEHEMKKTFVLFTLIVFVSGLNMGMLIGLRQQHKQKDYMIKVLLQQEQQKKDNNNVNLPLIIDGGLKNG